MGQIWVIDCGDESSKGFLHYSNTFSKPGIQVWTSLDKESRLEYFQTGSRATKGLEQDPSRPFQTFLISKYDMKVKQWRNLGETMGKLWEKPMTM